MYIICKQKQDGMVGVGTPSKVYGAYDDALQDVARIAAENASAYLIFKAVSRTEPERSPVKTTLL